VGPASYFLYIGIDPQDRMAEHKQNIKAIKYQNIIYKHTQFCFTITMPLVIFVVWVCLHYSHTVYPQMLPKHKKKLLILLFSHIISINSQNYNLFTSSTSVIVATYPSYYHMQCVTTYSLDTKCHSQRSTSKNETSYVQKVE
jgi:Trk-type K+ transport system membrane component